MKNELFSAKPDAEDRESARDLKREDFSAKFETKLNELPKVLVRPLTWDAARPNESLRDLNSEFFAPRLEDEPIEPLKLTV